MTGKVGNVQGASAPKRRQSAAPRSSCPRASGPSQPRSFTIADVKGALSPARVAAIATALFSGAEMRGRRYFACCPFHQEKTPSFTIHTDHGFYHCFGCGAHGDMIDLYMHLNNCTLREAIDAFAEALGL